MKSEKKIGQYEDRQHGEVRVRSEERKRMNEVGNGEEWKWPRDRDTKKI
jgi:hypothetical protein